MKIFYCIVVCLAQPNLEEVTYKQSEKKNFYEIVNEKYKL